MLRNAKGFTLIELMIVVAIIGILAAIAIPSFLAMQLRSKRSELPTNLDGIRTAEKAYFAEWDSFTTAALTPAAQPTRSAVDFTGGGLSAFQQLGWTADGKVRGQYSTTAVDGGVVAANHNFTADATSDVDGNGTTAKYTCNKDVKSNMTTANDVY